MSTTFKGKCGQSVEGLPDAWKGIEGDEREDIWYKYDDDASYRKTIGGPYIGIFAEDDGCISALTGLQIDLNFGHFGNVRGICNGEKECDEFEIEWRCGPDYKKESAFVSKHEGGYDAIAYYFQGRGPDEVQERCMAQSSKCCMAQSAVDFVSQARSAPKGTRFVNWKEPSYEDIFDDINDEDKWKLTLARLNDPKMAHHYGRASDAYPTLAFLAVYTIMANQSTYCANRLPIMVTNENERIFSLADDMCRQISSVSSYGCGYGNLIGFEQIVEKIKNEYAPMEDYDVWKGGYAHSQALMLVLSNDFEEAMWDYDMVNDLERLDKLVVNFLLVFASYMRIASVPSDAARDQLKKDLDFNDKHLKAGIFVSYAESNHEKLFSSTIALCVKNDGE